MTTCGTYAGYRAHIDAGEDPCTPCRDANATYMRAWRADRPWSPCSCCGRPGLIVNRHGWRQACYERWNRAGRPDGGPPPPRMSHAEMLTEYRVIRGQSSPDVLAARLGVGVRTVRGYEAELWAAGWPS